MQRLNYDYFAFCYVAIYSVGCRSEQLAEAHYSFRNVFVFMFRTKHLLAW